MPVVAGRIDTAGRRFTPDGHGISVEVYKTAPQSGAPPELVDLSLYAGQRVAIVCEATGETIWGASEIGVLTATIIAATAATPRIAPRGSTLRLDDGLLRPRCEVLFLNRYAIASASEHEIGQARPPMHQTIYMHRHGGRYTGGLVDDSARKISSVVGRQGYRFVDTAPFQGNDADWAEILKRVRDRFQRFDVSISDVEPTQGDYIEAVVTGNSGHLLGFDNNVIGYSPMWCSVIPNAVSFSFTKFLLGNNDRIAETVSHEVAHTMSLAHERLEQDLMYYLIGYRREDFLDQYIDVWDNNGYYEHCGSWKQNSVQRLFQVLGPASPAPAPVVPFVTIISPENEAHLPANSNITIVAEADEGADVSSVELIWDFTGRALSCPGSGTDWSCTKAGRIYNWQLNVGTGYRTYRVHAVDAQGRSMTTSSRSIQLIGGPPPTYQAPTITVDAPTSDSTLRRGQPFRIEAVVHSSDSPVQSVEMVWSGGPGGSYAHPLLPIGNDIWRLDTSMSPNAPLGIRELAIRAKTQRGETSTTPPTILHIV
jgi:hypothetical protein